MILVFADKYECDNIYEFSEEEGRTKIPRCHQMMVIAFSKNNFENLLEFIKQIKKIRQIHIECVYYDESNLKLIYASPYYLKNIDKDVAVRYKRDRSYSEEEIRVINVIS
jgi:hypothetical protein